MTRSRRRGALLVILLAVVINLPVAHSAWTDQRVEASGTDVTATVVDDRVVGGEEYWLSFTFPTDVDPDQQTWQVQVDEEAYDDAVAAGELQVRVLESQPSAYRVEGQVDSAVPLVVTLVADGLLVVVAVLLLRYGGRRRATLRAVALGDVERCPPAVVLERIGGEDYLVRGDVLELGEGVVVLDLGDRTLRVELDGHHNPVGYQQPAQVRVRLID